MTMITLELPDDLAKQLQKFDLETLIKLLRHVLSLYPAKVDSPNKNEPLLTTSTGEDNFLVGDHHKPIETLGDLLNNGYGLWADRDDIGDSLDYATQLRQDTWQRVL
ncbi:hypothetical protein QUF63_05975 [Anaerolineales bacterium HSG25]|nr:hypothetical protein [Anaerolineales bacterium HSG25]